MKYLLLINSNPDDAPTDPEALQARNQAWFAYSEGLATAGVLLGGEALKPAVEGRVTHLKTGLVTDGPFAEGKEVLGGFYLIDVPDMGAALEWANKMPDEVSVEIRECQVFDG